MFLANSQVNQSMRYLIPRLRFWNDYSNAASITRNESDQVLQVDDLSGNGNHATQGAEEVAPIYQASVVNGLSALYFSDLAQTYLHLPDGVLADGNSAYTFFCVVNLPLTNSYANGILNIGDLGTYAANTAIAVQNSGVANNWWWDDGDVSGVLTANTTTILEFVYDPAVGRISFINGVAGSTNAATDLNITQLLYNSAIGRAYFSATPGYQEYCEGYICEVLISDQVVSEFVRTKARYLLAKKWGAALGFQPSNISDTAWAFDSSKFDTITLDGDDAVSNWASLRNGINAESFENNPAYSFSSQNGLNEVLLAASYTYFGTAYSFNYGANDFSLIFLIKKSDDFGTFQGIFTNRNDTQDGDWCTVGVTNAADGTLAVEGRFESEITDISTTTNICDGVPHVIILRKAANYTFLYVDGVYAGGYEPGNFGGGDCTSFNLGIWYTDYQGWGGYLDYAQLITREINDTEIAQITSYFQSVWGTP